jgi:DNA-binding NtrC family response regulator/ligand-binding sensor domain-containing protein
MSIGTKKIFIILNLLSILIGNNKKLHLIPTAFNRTVNSMVQDSFGYMWFGTSNGLYRFDGGNYKDFKIEPYNLNSLSDDFITDLCENHHQELLIGTREGGLNNYDLKFETFHLTQYKPLISGKITSIEAGKSMDWIGTKHGLYLREREKNGENFCLAISDISVADIAIIDDENVMVGTDNGGLYFINFTKNSNWRFRHEQMLPQESVNFIYLLHDNLYLISTLSGFYYCDSGSRKLTKLDMRNFQENIHTIEKNCITQDDSGNLWLGKGYKLFCVNQYESIENLQINSYELDIENRFSSGINSLYYDRSGVLWVGFRGKGLYKYYPSKNFSAVNLQQGLMSDIIFCMLEYNTHSVLLGTHHGLFCYNFENETVARLPHTEALDFRVITALYKDQNMNLWCGTNEGLFKLTSNKELVQYRHSDKELSGISSNFITAIVGCGDNSGDVWIGTAEGLNRYRAKYDNFLHHYADHNDENSLAGNEISDLFFSSNRDLWIGTENNGISILSAEERDKFEPKFINYRNDISNKSTLSNNSITTVIEDSNQRIWIGTENGGLNLFDSSGVFLHFMEVNGLLDNEVLGIVPDGDSTLWISTAVGLSKFSINVGHFKNYGNISLGKENFLENSALQMKDGRIIFGAKSGLIHFFPKFIQKNTKPAIPVISQFFLFNRLVTPVDSGRTILQRSINLTDNIELQHDENVISLAICGLHYAETSENMLYYKLEGVDQDWQMSHNNEIITYSNLKPGDYLFRLQAANNDKILNPKEKRLQIKITAPFYNSFPAWLFYIFLVSLTIYLFLRYRIATINSRKIALEKQIEEKNRKNEALNSALREVEKLRDQLQTENTFLKSERVVDCKHKEIITDSKAMKNILHQIEIASGADPTILILGESGTGKDLLAKAIYNTSGRKEQHFIKVDCASLPPNLIESELFGHEKGAFTGADKRKIGRFELANGGTIFLDEIGELPKKVQQKLLRVLQSGEFERLGSSTTLKTNIRIIAATNRNLAKEVKTGQFREDLFYRLNVFPINLPPLRERMEDLPLLVQHFITKYSGKFNKTIDKIPNSVMKKLMAHSWPGNIRELENIIQRAIIISRENVLELGDWLEKNHPQKNFTESVFVSLEELQKRHIQRVLEYTQGKVSGEKGAAEILNINPKTLFSRMKKLNINN